MKNRLLLPVVLPWLFLAPGVRGEFVEGPLGVSRAKPILLNRTTYLPLSSLLEPYGFRSHAMPEEGRIILNSPALSLVLFSGRKEAGLDGEFFSLEAPVLVVNGDVLVPAYFVRGPLAARGRRYTDARAGLVRRKRKLRVIIDAGHGGRDAGAVGPTGLLEKEVNLDVARGVARRLGERGLDIVLTRGGDATLSLSGRGRIIEEAHGDLLLSVHTNAARNGEAAGFEVFYKDGPRETAQSGSTDEAGRLLAREIQKTLLSRIGGKDRGTLPGNFYIFRSADCPAVLVEIGFLSNPSDEEKLRRRRYREEVAGAIADAVHRWAMKRGERSFAFRRRREQTP